MRYRNRLSWADFLTLLTGTLLVCLMANCEQLRPHATVVAAPALDVDAEAESTVATHSGPRRARMRLQVDRPARKAVGAAIRAPRVRVGDTAHQQDEPSTKTQHTHEFSAEVQGMNNLLRDFATAPANRLFDKARARNRNISARTGRTL